jgi:hypothetical protein
MMVHNNKISVVIGIKIKVTIIPSNSPIIVGIKTWSNVCERGELLKDSGRKN